VHQETVNSDVRDFQTVDDAEDDDNGEVLDGAGAPPSDVASSDGHSQQEQPEYVVRRDSGEYDHSIWDFLSPAQGDDDEGHVVIDEDDDDDNEGSGGDGGGKTISLRSPLEADIRSAKHAQAVLEIVETEISYSNDLAIIKRVCNAII